MLGGSTAVAAERTGWRDQELSERHRRYGFNVPAVDIDFLLVEYDQGTARAIIEYKHERAGFLFPGHPNYRALVDLGDRAGVPVFAARYAGDFCGFFVIALNRLARALLPKNSRMTEYEFVSFLYRLRGRRMPEGIFDDKGILLTSS